MLNLSSFERNYDILKKTGAPAGNVMLQVSPLKKGSAQQKAIH